MNQSNAGLNQLIDVITMHASPMLPLGPLITDPVNSHWSINCVTHRHSNQFTCILLSQGCIGYNPACLLP